MKYSFILPAFKGRYLRDAISSILNQSYVDFELVIVDDCSPEDLKSIIDCFNDDRILYYRNSVNYGSESLVYQWNHSVSFARGEFIILASDDDKYHPDYLSRMDELVCQYPNADVYRPRVKYIDSYDNYISEETELPSGLISRDEYLQLLAEGRIYSGIPQYLFRKSALLSRGGFVNFPLAWFSDDATVISLSQNGLTFADRVLFEFRKSDISISSGKNSKRKSCDKVRSAMLYDEYLLKELEYNPIVLSHIRENVKRQTYYVIKDSDFNAFLPCLRIVFSSKNKLYDMPWYFKTVASFVKKKLVLLFSIH